MSAAGRSRSAAIALLAGVVVLSGAAILVPAAMRWTQDGGAIREERLKLLRAEDRRQAGERLTMARAAWTGFARSTQSGFVQERGTDGAIAASQDRIERVFVEYGGETAAVVVEVEPSTRKGVARIAIEARGTIPRTQLAALLAALESEPPFLILKRFEAETTSKDRLDIGLGGAFLRLEEDGT